MKIGTRSLLFGAHQFLLHPWFVAAAWCRLFGFPWDPRLWVAFFVHDIGYWEMPNMDGAEGEQHPRVGATIMGALFDYQDLYGHIIPRFQRRWYTAPIGDMCDFIWGHCPQDSTWYCFVFYHSRFLSKSYGVTPSRLCVADKLAIAYTPAWLYLPLVKLSGELAEYMETADKRHAAGERQVGNGPMAGSTPAQWYARVQEHSRAWAREHSDGKPDTWTPKMSHREDAP